MLSRQVIAKIQEQLQSHERSVAWLARKLEKPDQWVWRRFSGEVALSLNDVDAIASVLDLSIDITVREFVQLNGNNR